MTRPRDPFLLLATVFLSGACVMAVEMTASRLLQPYYGSSVYVWTNIIAVILVGLALGYFLGGRLADARPSLPVLAWILIIGGALVCLIPAFSTPVQRFFVPDPGTRPPRGFHGAIVAGSLATTLALFGPPVLILGAVAPFGVKLLTERGWPSGKASGSILMVSTLGSVLGTFLPAHVTVPLLGSRMTYLLAGSVLLLVGGALLVRRKAALPLVLLPLLLPFGVHARLSGTPLRPSPGLLQEEESAYQYLQVVEETRSEGRRAIALTLDEGRQDYQSYMIEGDPTTGGLYYDTMTLAALLPDQAHPLEILVLGAGAGTIPRSLSMLFGERIARIDTVEIDPAVVEVGRSFFLQNLPDGPPIETWTSDGRVFLHATPRRYDAILVDVYAHQLYIPFHFTTHQFFSLARRRMKPGSILALNVSTFGADSPLLLALSQSLQAVFPRVHRTPVLGTSWNQILVASTASARRSFADLEPEEVPSPLNGVWRAARETTVEMPRVPLGSRSGPLLTDDRAPVEQLLREELAVATPLAPKRPADSWPEDDAPPEIIDVALAGKKFSEFETLWREGREDEALAAFRQAFRADPDHTAFGSWAFGTFLLSGHVKATALFFEDALARRPDDADLLYHAAWSRFHTGDPGGAMGLLERLIATSPDVETETKAWGDLGYFRFTTGDLASAGEAYRNQARLAPEDAGAAKGLEAIAEAGRCRTRTRTALVIGPLLLAGILVLGIRRPRPG